MPSVSREEMMVWAKDVAAGLGLLVFIAGSFALASAANAALVLH
jgi:hypothetical protein